MVGRPGTCEGKKPRARRGERGPSRRGAAGFWGWTAGAVLREVNLNWSYRGSWLEKLTPAHLTPPGATPWGPSTPPQVPLQSAGEMEGEGGSLTTSPVCEIRYCTFQKNNDTAAANPSRPLHPPLRPLPDTPISPPPRPPTSPPNPLHGFLALKTLVSGRHSQSGLSLLGGKGEKGEGRGPGVGREGCGMGASPGTSWNARC